MFIENKVLAAVGLGAVCLCSGYVFGGTALVVYIFPSLLRQVLPTLGVSGILSVASGYKAFRALKPKAQPTA